MSVKKEQPAYDSSLRPALQPGQLGDWASFLAVALFVALWLSWPNSPEGSEGRSRANSEFTCSYGNLDVRSYSGTVLRHFNSGYGDDGDMPLVKMPAIALPAIPASVSEPFASGAPPAEDEKFRRLPSLRYALPPVERPYRVSALVPTGTVVVVSSRLRAADFALAVPEVTNSFSLTASVLFSAPLDLPSVMIESFTGPDEVLAAWREALLFSSVSSPAAGTVTASR